MTKSVKFTLNYWSIRDIYCSKSRKRAIICCKTYKNNLEG